jgi:hypothetical protein
VTFARPFFLRRIDRELPAGSYPVETEEEALEGVSGLSYRRIEIRLFTPRVTGVSEAEMWVISPGDLDAALALDREPASRREQGGDLRSVAHNAAAARLVAELALHDRQKGSNAPLYGTLLGVLALLLATVAFGRQGPAGSPPSLAVAAQGAGEN